MNLLKPSLLFITLCIAYIIPGQAQTQDWKKLVAGKNYEAHTLLLKLKPKADFSVRKQSIFGTSFQDKLSHIQGNIVPIFPNYKPVVQTLRTTHAGLPKAPDLSLLYRIDFKADISVIEAMQKINDSELIEYVEPSFLHTTQMLTPNDPLYSNQESYLKKIKADLAWDVTKGSSEVIIAITDTGLDMDHPDLVNNIYKNTDEIDENGIDDDNDGYVDNVLGWDFIGATLDNPVADNNPDIGANGQEHGTHVTGIIGASLDNNVGIAGIAPNCKLLILKIGDDSGINKVARGYEAIVYAADQGAHIINASWGGVSDLHSKVEQEAITYATSKGALVITSAGNSNNGTLYQDPSAYQFVMSVASVTNQDAKSGFSNYGKNTDISAPGESIMSTVANGLYNVRQGTSMASAIVAGAAALVKSQYPKATGLQIAEILKATSDDIQSLNPGFGDNLGKGRVNILRALTESTPPAIRMTEQLSLVEESGVLKISSTFTNLLANTTAPVTIKVSGENTFFEVTEDSVTTATNLDSLGSYNNNSAPLQLKFKADAPRHWITTLAFTYRSGAYEATEYVTVKLRSNDYLTIEKNQLKVTLSDYGRVGNDENLNYLQGEGLVYKNNRLLFSSGLMIGKSAARLVDAVQSDATPFFHDHFTPTQPITAVTTPKLADFEYEGVVTDANAGSSKLGLEIKTRYYIWNKPPNDKFLILEHTITNTSNETHENLYAGWFADWDVNPASGGSNLNQARWDEAFKLGYIYSVENEASNFGGIALISSNVDPAYYALVNENVAGNENLLSDGFSNDEKFKTLSSGTSNNVAPISGATDVSQVVGAGPFTLAPNASTTITFAFVAGDNLEDIQTQVEAIQQLLNGVSSLPPALATKNQIEIRPNPNEGTFQIKTGGVLIKNIEVMGLQGQLILEKKLVNDTKLHLHLQDLPSGVYLLRAYTTAGFITKRIVIR
ncbi:MAG TPA: hypothetical protein DCS93_14680 [Microscillaceae bacterium]|nr:hypothetical protein [Microscillaceae bacterium]